MVDQSVSHVTSGQSIIADLLLGGAAASTPLWLQSLETWAQAIIVFGGVVLLGIRIAIALKELRKKGH